MDYTRKHGELALRYMLFCIKFELRHDQKLAGADYFKISYQNFFEVHLSQRRRNWVCKQRIGSYCEELAIRACEELAVSVHANPELVKRKQALAPPSKCFLWMSFVYVTCAALNKPFDIGSGFVHIAKDLASVAPKRMSYEELSFLMSEVVSHMFALRLPAQEQSLRLAS